jgi:4-carboxymuconolactone decarboxylase
VRSGLLDYRCRMRLPHLKPSDLDEDQQRLYDALTTGQRRAVHDELSTSVQLLDAQGRLQGPFNAMLVHPRLGYALQELSRQLRFEGHLPVRTREIVILTVAASEQSDFEWAAHSEIAARVGVAQADIAAIAAEATVEFDDPVDEAAAQLARWLVNHGDVDDDTYMRVQPELGDDGIFEVSTTVGVYQLIAQQLRIFRVDAPRGPWGNHA